MSDNVVSEKKLQALEEQMVRLEIFERDLQERFVRSQGPGGQHVNKTSTCVVLKHLPTGISVRCDRERSQSLNRFLARRLLVNKIESERMGKLSAQQQQAEKIRRQKRKRSKRAKEKMLANKRHQSQKKQLRQLPSNQEH